MRFSEILCSFAEHRKCDRPLANLNDHALMSFAAQSERLPMHETEPVSHREIEVKRELAPATLLTRKKIPLFQTIMAPPKRASQVSVYFDTDKHKLWQKVLMLRVRRQGRRYTQTIKSTTKSGPFQRDEWETEIT